MTKLFLVMNKNDGHHYIVRFVDEEAQGQITYSASAQDLNALLAAKSQWRVLEAVGKMPPLLPGFTFRKRRRSYTADEVAGGKLADMFTRCDGCELGREFYLDSAGHNLRANVGSLDSLVRKCGSTGDAIVKEASDASGKLVVVEPVTDWVVLRNMLSIAARLIGNLQNGLDGAELLRRSGFVQSSIYRDWWGTPLVAADELQGDPRVDRGGYSSPLLEAILQINRKVKIADFSPWSFRDEETEEYQIEQMQKYGNVCDIDWIDPGCPIGSSWLSSAESLTSGSSLLLARQDADLFASSDFPEVESLLTSQSALCLCVHNARGVAERAAMTIVEAFKTLTGDYFGERYSLGWSIDNCGMLGACEQPVIALRSYAAALAYTTAYHPKAEFAVCRMCGNAVLGSIKGARKEFCTDSCRVRYANLHGSASHPIEDREYSQKEHTDGNGSEL